RFLEVRKGLGEPRGFRGRPGQCLAVGALEVLAQAQLQLTGSLLGERDGRYLVDARASRGERGDDAADERRGLPRARGSLDDERLVERRADALAILVVGQRTDVGQRQRHRSSLTISRSPSGWRSFRLVRVCEPGPQTGA